MKRASDLLVTRTKYMSCSVFCVCVCFVCIEIESYFIFSANNPFYNDAPVLQLAGMSGMVFRNVIAHALLAERTLATVLASRYENYTKPWFSIAWFSAAVPHLFMRSRFFLIYLINWLAQLTFSD